MAKVNKIFIMVLLAFSCQGRAQMTITVKMAAMPYNLDTEADWLQNGITASQEGVNPDFPNELPS